MRPRILLPACRGILRLLRRELRDGLGAWNHFWFAPADPMALGLMRLLTGWMLFYNLLVWTLDLEAFFSSNGLQPWKAISSLHVSRPVVSFWMWLDDSWLWPVHAACLLIAAMFCLGLFTRVTSVFAFLITISYSQRVPIANFGFDQILGLLCLYLSLAPAGAAFSLDALLAARRRRKAGREPQQVVRSSAARMSMRLIQLHLCAIYFWAGMAKLKGPTWWTGEAFWRVIANEEYQTMDLTWMAWVPWLPYLLAHITIIWEIFFIVLIWHPRLRPLMLAIGTGMHLGIGLFLGMWTFGMIMIFAYLSFLDTDVWRDRWCRLSDCFRNEPESDSGMAVPPPGNHQSLCLIADSAHDRSALRRYFRSHQVDCRALGDLNNGLALLPGQSADAMIIHAAGFSTARLLQFTADAADLNVNPILVLLCSRQQALTKELERMPGVQWMYLPASLHEIRERVVQLMNCVSDSPRYRRSVVDVSSH